MKAGPLLRFKLTVHKLNNSTIIFNYNFNEILDLFCLCPPSLVGAYYLHPPDARAIYLHSDLLCNGTCFVTERITYWGAQTEKIRNSIHN